MNENKNHEVYSREALVTMVKFFPFPMAVFTKDFEFHYINSSFFEILGYENDQFQNIDQWFNMVYPDVDYRELLRKDWDKTLEELKPGQIKNRLVALRCSGGNFLQLKMKLYRDYQQYFYLTFENITDLVDIEKSLKEQKEEYRILFEQSPVGIFHFDIQGKIERCNNQFVTILGSTRSQLIGFNMLEKLKNNKVREGIVTALNGQTMDFYGPYTSVTSGKEIFIDLHIVPLRKNGNIIGGVGIVRDISDKYRMEMKLYENEQKFRNIFGQISEGLVLVAPDGKIVEWNTAFEKITGVPSEQIGKLHIWELQVMLNPPEKQRKGLSENIQNIFQQLIQNNESVSSGDSQIYEICTPSGECKMVENTLFPIQMEIGIYLGAVLREVTRRVHTERALKDREAQFRALFEYAGVGIVMSDKYGRIQKVNKTLEKILGYTESELLGKQPRTVSNRLDYRNELKLYRDLITGERKSYQLDKRFIRKDGKQIWATLSVTTFPVEGEDMALIGVLIDITKRKQYQEELVLERNKLAATLDSLMDTVVAVDRDMKIIFMNSAGQLLFDKKIEGLINRQFEKEFVFLDSETAKAIPMSSTRKMIQLSERRQLKIKINGEIKDIMISSKPIVNEFKEYAGSVCLMRDVTEQLKTDAELRRHQRYDSMEIMAGGIAHDFNNILTAITGNVSMAELLAKDKQMSELLRNAINALNRARQLTNELLSFSKSDTETKKKFIDAAAAIQGSAGLFSVASDIDIQYHFDDHLWPIEVDPGQFSQMVENLLINAMQAMDGAGVIRISAENLESSGKITPKLKNGPVVRIIFEDNGPGIPRHLQSKIFEPFYTTKKKGTGLGLAIVYSIVQRHHGWIEASNTDDHGARFEILLPAHPGVRVQKQKSSGNIKKGQGSIMLLDDEPMIRDVAQKMLDFLGFHSIIVSCGERLLEELDELIKTNRLPDLIILDVTVPGKMGGEKTAEELLKRKLQVPFVFSSGYTNSQLMKEYGKFGAAGTIAKPFRIDSLFECLYNIIPGNFS